MAFLRYPEGTDHDRSLRVRRERKSHDRLEAEQTDACQKEDVCDRLLVLVRASEAGGARTVLEKAVAAALRQQGGGDRGVQVVSNLLFRWKKRGTSKGISLFGCSP